MFIAKVVFWGSEKGGRFSPPQSGFRPQIDVGSVHTSCWVESLDGKTVFEFDIEHNVMLKMLYPDEYEKKLTVGSPVHLYEGSKLIGSGRILDILDSKED